MKQIRLLQEIEVMFNQVKLYLIRKCEFLIFPNQDSEFI